MTSESLGRAQSTAQSCRRRGRDRGTFEQLREFGCDQFQGFYHSQAVLPGKIKQFLPPTGGAQLLELRIGFPLNRVG